ncbi:hypothetical protein RD1_4060 [Roseobacter denitrificans OCh 114]|uniref:Uncharacterized protein n=1 Tax=Roseobacter denitrificans (strain ATCC 33942 / OCh 114) TaxID=375451 RepID=Q160T9_ROSDO|nr:hypothetical protein RD1_4060 [Roseobacter denitrificans OCh 114]
MVVVQRVMAASFQGANTSSRKSPKLKAVGR